MPNTGVFNLKMTCTLLLLTGYLSLTCVSALSGPSGPTLTYVSPVTAGFRTTFTCKSTCIPQCTYSWVLKGRIFNGSMLTWTPDGLDSSVDLQCIAVNTENGRSSTATTTVEVTNSVLVQLVPGSVFPTLNQSFSLTCQGSNRGLPVLWYKDGQTLAPDPGTDLLDFNTTLRFNSLLPSNGGFYQCQVSQPNGGEVFSLGYLINFEPWVVTISGPDTVEIGRRHTFTCKVNCTISVDCSISWQFKGGFPSGSFLSIRKNILVWAPSTPGTFQNFTCVAQNDAAGLTAEETKTVEVKEGIVIPVSGSETGMLSAMLVMVSCLGLLFLFES